MTDLIDETLNEIKRNWNITLQEDLNPIPIALELLQQSNPAHDFDSFVRLHGQLETCMEWVVENNYTGFNGAVSTFGGISDSIKECKRISSLITTNLQEFRDQIQYKRTDLPELWAKIEQYKLKISALTTLAEMKRLRGEAAELTKKRFFVPAARVLAGILHELGLVGAELDGVDREFARELREDRETFLERLLEEFCLHAFLKVPASTTQLVAQALSTFPSLREFPNEFSQEQKRQLVVAPEGDLVMVPTEFNYSPDSNVQSYIYSLFQAAHCLGCLADFCNAIEQRLASELFQIADADVRRVNRRFHRERIVQKSQKGPPPTKEDALLVLVPTPLLSHHDLLELEAFAPFLKAFMDTLLVKLSVIMALFWKMAEQPFDESSADILKSLFEAAGKAIHEEVRNVLGTFLKGSKMAIQLVPTNHVQSNASPPAPRATFLFKMTISEEQDDEMRPSLGGIGALLTQREKNSARKFAKMLVVDQFSSAKEDFGHRPVVKPSLQFLPLLFPSFSFFSSCLAELGLDGEQSMTAGDISPVSIEEADSRFLERYVADDFLPFLDTFVNQELSMAFNSLESLVGERVRAEKPDVVRVQGKSSDIVPHCVKSFINLFNLLVRLALRISTHRTSFEGLIKTACTIFTDRIGSLLQGITKARGKEGDATVAPFFSARQAVDVSIRDLLRAHPLLEESRQEKEKKDQFIAESEAVLLERAKGDRSLGVEEVILEDHRRIQDLALLQRGLELLPGIIFTSPEIKWLVSHSKNELKFTSDGQLVSGEFQFSAPFAAFLGIFLTQIAQHAVTTLITLRIEIRSHAFYYIDLAMREGNYRLEEPSCEPDVYINTLCRELMGLESILADRLPYDKYVFCVEGLGPILQTILINGYKQIKECNPNGYLKLHATVKALEQLMALISPSYDGADLDRVRAYYVLAQAGPKQLLDGAKECRYRYTQSQYQAILDSHYKLNLNSDADSDDETSMALRREYQNQLVRLQYLNK